jgi:hypothetical protein
MNRPTNVAIAAAVTLAGAVFAALAAIAFFSVALLVAIGTENGDPVSIAIIGMGVAGGFALLILASLAACLAISMPEFRDWARNLSISASAAAMLGTLRQTAHSLLSSATHSWAAAFPSRNKNHKLSFRPLK